MRTKDDGGQAFPMLGNVGYQTEWQIGDGMSLRDYFAAKAMQIAHEDQLDCSFAELAEQAYGLADAMLRERAK